jgi:hypothetical protein
MKQGRGKNIDPLRHLRTPMSNDLCPQELSTVNIARDPYLHWLRTGIVSLVVPRGRLYRSRMESRIPGFMIAESGSTRCQFEDLHNLGTNRTVKLFITSNRVLTRNPALLV